MLISNQSNVTFSMYVLFAHLNKFIFKVGKLSDIGSGRDRVFNEFKSTWKLFLNFPTKFKFRVTQIKIRRFKLAQPWKWSFLTLSLKSQSVFGRPKFVWSFNVNLGIFGFTRMESKRDNIRVIAISISKFWFWSPCR